MKSFTGMPNTDGTSPHVEARGDTLPGQHDGTPLRADWLNEFFGFVQAAMNGAGMMPSGTADIAGASAGDIESCQVLQAIQAMFIPPGIILPLASATIQPSMRLLACNGQVVACADYPRLVANTYIGNSLNPTAHGFYKTSDAGGTTRSTTGAYFVLPDLRGYFLRGYDPTAEHDPQGASRHISHNQVDSVNAHTHWGVYRLTAGDEIKASTDLDTFGTTGTHRPVGGGFTGEQLETGSTGDDIGTETRPINAAFQWCVTY